MTEKTLKYNSITDGRLIPALIKFAVPLMLSLLLQGLYGAVDLIIVGQFGDSSSVSAVSMGSQIMHLITVLITGIAMGGTVIIGKYFGAKDFEKSAKAIGNISTIMAITAVVLTVFVVSLANQIASILNVPTEAFKKCVDYVLVCGGGIIFIVAYNLLSAVFRGIGNSRVPLFFILIACIINIVLDLVFVALLHMDSLGAGLATIIAQAVSVLCSLLYLKFAGIKFKVSKQDFKLSKKMSKELMKIGSPIAISDFLTALSFVVISAFINNLGLVASASVGITERMFLFLSIVTMSFMMSISTFVAQNMGAKQPKRANQSFLFGYLMSLVVGIGLFFLLYFGGELLARLFTTDQAVIESTGLYFKGGSFEYLMSPFVFCAMGYLNARGRSTLVMLQGLLVAFFIRIPLSYYVTSTAGMTMYDIGTTIPISFAFNIAILLIVLIATFIRDKKGIAFEMLKNDLYHRV